MERKRIRQQYDAIYTDLGFERRGLFELLRRQFSAPQVTYLGSSIHVTASFYFPHVCYIDNSEQSRVFFADITEVCAFVSERKQYRRAPHVEYLHADYGTSSFSRQVRAPLVLALYAPGTLQLALHFLQQDGIFIYLPLPGESDLEPPPDLAQIGTIVARRDAYTYQPGSKAPPASAHALSDRGRFRDDGVYGVFAA